jgi:FdhD protein
MANGRTQQTDAHRTGGAQQGFVADELVVEEPLEIHLDEQLVATTMRTPGHDFELATGFLWAEGLLAAAPSVVVYGPAGSVASAEFNSVMVLPGPDDRATDHQGLNDAAHGDMIAHPGAPMSRLGLMSSSCGICGARQIEALTERLEPFGRSRIPDPRSAYSGVGAPSGVPEVLTGTHGAIRSEQDLFALTGGSHSCAAVDLTGTAVVVREDIGRHNAVDKVTGAMLFDKTLPALDEPVVRDEAPWTLWVSGRASFEIIQKAWAGGFATVVAVGAVSALALHTARRANMTLVGFSREERATVYTGGERWGLA